MKGIFIALLGLVSVPALSAGIPYNIACQGQLAADPGVKLTLSTKSDPQLTLLRHTTARETFDVDFQVQKISHRGRRFELTSLGNVAFAGGGTLTGTLSVMNLSGKGTWNEETRVFNEATGQMEVSNVTYDVTCTIAQ